MSLKIVYGRSGSGKSTYLLNDMQENDSVIYIVPEQFSFSAEKMLINKFGMVGLGKPQVLSFMRLADTVFSKYGAPDFMADSASFEMLVSYCANCVKHENLKLFDGLVKKSELAATASVIISTFKRYRITEEQLFYAIENTADELLKKKLMDSLIIYKAYNNEAKLAEISDHNDMLSILADTLSDESCDFLSGKHIYIDQFTDFDPSEYDCIRQMILRAEDVTVALCTDKSSQFETVNRTFDRLVTMAKKVGTPPAWEVEISSSVRSSSPMLRHLERVYFDDETPQFAGNDGSIKIFCGKNKFSEIHNAAREIVRLVRDNGYRYRDISIIARDVEMYKSIVDRVFPTYEIPVFADRKMPLSGHSIAMYITSVIDVVLGGFSYENIFAYIKSPFSPISPEESDELENYCIATGINSYAWKSPFKHKSGVYKGESSYSKDAYTPEVMERINSLREKVYNPLAELSKKLKGSADVTSLCTCLFDFLEAQGLERKVRNFAATLEENGENLHALQTTQVYNILIDIFNDICSVIGDKKISLKEFKTTLDSGFKSVEIGTIPSSSDCVTLGSIDRIKGHGAKAVFIVGANSGVFPSYPTDNGLFSDEDKEALEGFGIEMPPNLLRLTQSEQLLIYDAITCAEESLVISYSSADNESKALLPSEIVERVVSVFPDITYYDDLTEKEEGIEQITSKKAVFDLLCSKLREYRNNEKPLSDIMKAAAYYFSKDEVYAPLLNQAIDMTEYSNSANKIYANLIGKALGNEMRTSISKLETYNKCPFSFFAKYLLKLEPKSTTEVSLSDSGSFLHDFLDKFSVFISNSTDPEGNPYTWKTIDNDFIRIHTPEILKEILSGVNKFMLDIPRIKALFDRLCRMAEKAAYAVRKHITGSDFIPLGYEISFDDDGKFKPTKIKLPDGKTVILNGRIDRADEFSVTLPDGNEGKFVRVVDYKSSEKALSLSDVYHGIQLQLFVYLSTLCDNGYTPAGILYCNLTDPIVPVSPSDSEDVIEKKRSDLRRMSGIVLSEFDMAEHMGGKEIIKGSTTATAKNFNSMFSHLNRVIKNTASDIYDGKFPIKCTAEACTWCDFAHLCRFDGAFSGCSENNLPKLSNEEIWELLEEEVADNELD